MGGVTVTMFALLGIFLMMMIPPGTLGQSDTDKDVPSCSPYNCDTFCSPKDCMSRFEVFLMWIGMIVFFLTCSMCCRYGCGGWNSRVLSDDRRASLAHRFFPQPVIGGWVATAAPYQNSTGPPPPASPPFVIPMGAGGDCPPPPEYMPPPSYSDCVINVDHQKGKL